MYGAGAATRYNHENDAKKNTFTVCVEVPLLANYKGAQFKVDGISIPPETNYLCIRLV